MKLDYDPRAVDELNDTAAYYDFQTPGRGQDFLNEFERALDKKIASPHQYEIIRGSIRRLALKRFPYAVLYRVSGDHIRILVIRHDSRHPDFGLDRG